MIQWATERPRKRCDFRKEKIIIKQKVIEERRRGKVIKQN